MQGTAQGKTLGDLGGTLYDGAASYGRFMAVIGLVVGNVIGLLLAGGGVYLLATKGTCSERATATVQCERGAEANAPATTCPLFFFPEPWLAAIRHGRCLECGSQKKKGP